MPINTAALTRPVGPLPLWGWGALAAGGALLVMARMGHPAASAIVNPAVATPAPPVAASGPALPATVLPAGSTAYDPNTGTRTAPVSISDLIGGGNLADFIGKLGPDYTNFQFQAGDLGTSVSHVAASDAANTAQSNLYAYTLAAAQMENAHTEAIQGMNLAYDENMYGQTNATNQALYQSYLNYDENIYAQNLSGAQNRLAYLFAGARPGSSATYGPGTATYTYGAQHG